MARPHQQLLSVHTPALPGAGAGSCQVAPGLAAGARRAGPRPGPGLTCRGSGIPRPRSRGVQEMPVPGHRTKASARPAGWGPSPRSLGCPAHVGRVFLMFITPLFTTARTTGKSAEVATRKVEKRAGADPPCGNRSAGRGCAAGHAPKPATRMDLGSKANALGAALRKAMCSVVPFRDILKQILKLRAAPGSQHDRAESTGCPHVPLGRGLTSPSVNGGRARTPQGAAAGGGQAVNCEVPRPRRGRVSEAQ